MPESHVEENGAVTISYLEKPYPDRMWQIDLGRSNNWLLATEDPNGWYKAECRRDGCIDLHRQYNLPYYITREGPHYDAFEDHFHICDIDDMIRRLQSLRELLTHATQDATPLDGGGGTTDTLNARNRIVERERDI